MVNITFLVYVGVRGVYDVAVWHYKLDNVFYEKHYEKCDERSFEKVSPRCIVMVSCPLALHQALRCWCVTVLIYKVMNAKDGRNDLQL